MLTTIRRRDPIRRMARFYALAVQADTLAGWCVVREWGRIGCAGRVRVDAHGDIEPGVAAAQRLEG